MENTTETENKEIKNNNWLIFWLQAILLSSNLTLACPLKLAAPSLWLQFGMLTQMTKSGNNVDFNFITSPSQVTSGASCLQKMMPCTMFLLIQTYCKQLTHWRFPLFHTVLWFTHVHQVLLVSYDTIKTEPYIQKCLICRVFAKFQGMHLIPNSAL